MDLFKAMQIRKSIRAYSGEPVTREQLMLVLEAARCAPSWKNTQRWRYIAVTDRKLITALGEAVGYNPGRQVYESVPCFIVLCADAEGAEERGGKQYYMTDMGISMQQLVLAATAQGLGTCWIGAFDEQPVRDVLSIPADIRVVALTPLGVPDEQPSARPRKPMASIAFENGWGKALRS